MTRRHAAVLAGRQADVEVGPERLRHLAGEPGADVTPVIRRTTSPMR